MICLDGVDNFKVDVNTRCSTFVCNLKGFFFAGGEKSVSLIYHSFHLVENLVESYPVSGSYAGEFAKTNQRANLGLKIDVDRITKYSSVLNTVSGSISKYRGTFLR